jgi:hypothetical protein
MAVDMRALTLFLLATLAVLWSAVSFIPSSNAPLMAILFGIVFQYILTLRNPLLWKWVWHTATAAAIVMDLFAQYGNPCLWAGGTIVLGMAVVLLFLVSRRPAPAVVKREAVYAPAAMDDPASQVSQFTLDPEVEDSQLPEDDGSTAWSSSTSSSASSSMSSSIPSALPPDDVTNVSV